MAMNTAVCISLTLWKDPGAWLVLEQVFICKEEAGRSSLSWAGHWPVFERGVRTLGPLPPRDRFLKCTKTEEFFEFRSHFWGTGGGGGNFHGKSQKLQKKST